MTSKTIIIVPKEFETIRKKSYIIALWHGRLLGVFFINFLISRLYILASQNKDAQIVTDICRLGGAKVIRGSINKNGVTGLRSMIKVLKKPKTVVVMTPDGPIGPRMRASVGIASLATLSGCPILPYSISARGCVWVNSWDKFFIPMPFSKIFIVLGKPTLPKRSSGMKRTLEEIRSDVEKKLNQIMWEYDAKIGVRKIYPQNINKKGEVVKIKIK